MLEYIGALNILRSQAINSERNLDERVHDFTSTHTSHEHDQDILHLYTVYWRY